MRSASLIAAVVALASGASAVTIPIQVGPKGAFTFSPNNVTAAVGDVLEFTFNPLNHSVVMGDFANPCQPAPTGGFFSGFFAVGGGDVGSQVFQVMVNSTDPMFFYCAQPELTHCASGMSGVVNGPSTGNTLAAYQAASKGTKVSNPPSVFGGVLVNSSPSSSSPSSAASAASATTSCGGAAAAATSGTTTSGTTNGYKRSTTCSGAGSVQASVGIVAAFTLGMAILLS